MEQVRSLLFGAQVKEIEDRIIRQEKELLSRIETLTNETRASLDRCENALKERVGEERSKRNEANEQIESKLAKIRNELDASAKAAKESLSRAEGSLSSLIAESNDRLLGAIDDRYENAMKALGNLADTLRQELVAKQTLSTLVGELANGVIGAETNGNADVG
jgi:DNA anti-recombination protein RmuC